MKRKVLSVLLTFVLLISVVGCSQEQKEEDEKIKIGLSFDGSGVNDGGFNEMAYDGAKRAAKELGVDVIYLVADTCADYSPNMHALIDEGCDVVIAIGYSESPAVQKMVEYYPDVMFVTVDDALPDDYENVKGILFKQEQAAYLVGYIAGKVTKTDIVGFELGMSSNVMNRFGYGYLAGVIDANKDAQILQCNANSFTNSAIGKNDATLMISSGADVIFHAAGPVGLGVFDACAESGIKAIGVDTDQHALAEGTVITSAMKRVDNAVYDTIFQYVKGTLSPGVEYYDVEKKGLDIAPTTKYLEPDVLEEIDEVKKKIIAGEIVVPATKEEFEDMYGDIYILD